MKNNVLYLSYDGMTDPLGQSQVIPYLIGLKSYGFRFSIISFEKPNLYEQRGQMIRDLLENYDILWYPEIYHKSPPLLSTLYDLMKMRKAAHRLHTKHTFQVIHCRSYISAFVGVWMKKKFGTGFIFDMRGFWADERVEGGIWKLKNPVFKVVYNFFKKKEKHFLQQADHVITLTRKAKEIIHNWNWVRESGTAAIAIKVIPCCTDLELFDYRQQEEASLESMRVGLGISKGDFVLSYVGSFGSWYMLDEMLWFFQRLQKNIPRTKFMMLSKDNPQLVYSKLDTYGIDRKDIIVRQSERKNMPKYLMLSSMSIFFILPVFSKKASSPTKQGEIMGMGIPLIANSGIGDSDTIIAESGCGHVIHDFNEDEFDAAVAHIPVLLQQSRERIRQGAMDHYALTTGVERYHEVYCQVMEKKQLRS